MKEVGKITDSDCFKQVEHCKATNSNTDFSQVTEDLHYDV